MCFVLFLRLMFTYFCSYQHVLDVFRYFVSCQAVLAFCKSCCREAYKSIKNNAKINQNPSQVYRNGAQERPEKQHGSKLAQECAPETKSTCFLSPLGRFRAPLWAQLGAKGLPKSNILAPSYCKCSQNEIQGRVQKENEMLIEICMENLTDM